MAAKKSGGRKGARVVEVEPPEPGQAPDQGKPAREKRAELEAFLKHYEARIAQVLPRHLTPERMLRLMMNECARVPKLLACTPASVLAVLVEASELGLELGSTMGLAWPIPRLFNRGRPEEQMRATLLVGYRGLQQLARRSGDVRTISAQVVREADAFHYEQGSSPSIRHVPAWQEDVAPDGSDVVAAYAVVQLTTGEPQLEVMNRSQLDKASESSQAGDEGPWVTDYDEMARKTVFRRISKWLPQATDLQRALRAMDRADSGAEHDVEAEVRTAAPAASGLQQLTRQLTAGSQEARSPWAGRRQASREPERVTRQGQQAPTQPSPRLEDLLPQQVQDHVNALARRLTPNQVAAARQDCPGWCQNEEGLRAYAAALERLATESGR